MFCVGVSCLFSVVCREQNLREILSHVFSRSSIGRTVERPPDFVAVEAVNDKVFFDVILNNHIMCMVRKSV